MLSDDALKETYKQELKKLGLQQELGEIVGGIRAIQIKRTQIKLRSLAIKDDDPRQLSKLAALMRDDTALELEQAELLVDEAKLLERIKAVDAKIREIEHEELHRQAASAVGSFLGSLLGEGLGRASASLFGGSPFVAGPFAFDLGGGSPSGDFPFDDILDEAGFDLGGGQPFGGFGGDPLAGFNPADLFGRRSGS